MSADKLRFGLYALEFIDNGKCGDVLVRIGQAQQPDMLYWQVQ